MHASRPGDTIALGEGHHWTNDLVVHHPLRILGQGEKNLVIVEVKGSVYSRNNMPRQARGSVRLTQSHLVAGTRRHHLQRYAPASR